jgi:hypothetical protein
MRDAVRDAHHSKDCGAVLKLSQQEILHIAARIKEYCLQNRLPEPNEVWLDYLVKKRVVYINEEERKRARKKTAYEKGEKETPPSTRSGRSSRAKQAKSER